jgi:hypothetical protein
MRQHAPTELLKQQPAYALKISLQGLRRLLDAGALEAVEVGSGERLLSAGVLGYKAERDARRRAGPGELTRLTEELGGYEQELKRPLGEDK